MTCFHSGLRVCLHFNKNFNRSAQVVFHIPGVHADECDKTIFAKRESIHVPMGGELQLSSDVQHCGEKDWTWIWTKISNISNKSETTVSPEHLTNHTLSANKTRLVLHINNLKKSDEGSYGCKVTWKGGDSSHGNRKSVILTGRIIFNSLCVLLYVCVCVCACVCEKINL